MKTTYTPKQKADSIKIIDEFATKGYNCEDALDAISSGTLNLEVLIEAAYMGIHGFCTYKATDSCNQQ